jgi:hypothetical protein
MNYLHGAQSFLRSHCTATPEILHLLRNLKVHHHSHNSLPFLHILSQMNFAHILPPYLLKTHLNIILFMPTSSKWSLPFSLSDQIWYAFDKFPRCAACPIHLILLGHSTNIWWEVQNLWLHPSSNFSVSLDHITMILTRKVGSGGNNASDLYSEGAWFQSQLGHELCWDI